MSSTVPIVDAMLAPDGRSAIRYFSLGRHALQAALASIGVGAGDSVLMPGFICRDLLASLHAVGASAVFYEVDRALAPKALPYFPGVKAVIAVNYFGFPQSIDPFRAHCSEHSITLIEDNAHGFLSRDSQGNALGTRGDFGIASMRKTLAIPDGAALLANRHDVAVRLPPIFACRKDPLSATFLAKRTLRKVQAATGIPARTFGEGLVRGMRKIRSGHAFVVSGCESEVLIPREPAMHCESLAMLAKLEAESEVRRRRHLYFNLQSELQGLGIDPLFPDLPENVAPYGYPFRADDVTAAAVSGIARRLSLDCGRWPELPAAVVRTAPDFYRNVFWVNFLC